MTTKARLERLEKAMERRANREQGFVWVSEIERGFLFEGHRYSTIEELVAAHGLQNATLCIGEHLEPDPLRPEDMAPCP